jgi:hypothetical protein
VGTSASEALAKLALEAAERVRPRRDPTNAMRSRQHRAKKRAERNVAGDGTSNVAEAGRNVAAERNVTRNVAGGETLPETLLAAAASGNAERMAVLFAKLVDAASANVQPGATDLQPIAALLEQGCNIDLDVFSGHRGKFLQLHLTIEDDGAFTTAWTATLTYVPGPDLLPEVACAENRAQY